MGQASAAFCRKMLEKRKNMSKMHKRQALKPSNCVKCRAFPAKVGLESVRAAGYNVDKGGNTR